MMFSSLGILISAVALGAPGDHIRVGDVVLVPDVDVGMEYRTNVFKDESLAAPGTNLRISPGLMLKVDNPNNEFILGGEWEFRKFLFVGDDESGTTTAERISALDQFNEFGLDASLDALRQEVVGLQLANKTAVRNSLTDATFTGSSFNTRIRNNMDGGLRISPGPALAIVPGGNWIYDDYRTVGATDRRYNQRNTYGPYLRVKWDFFPRTSLILNSSYQIFNWADNVITDNVDGTLTGGVIELPNSRQFKLETGLSGRFSTKLYLDVLFGYGFAVYDGVDPFDNLTGLEGFRTSLQARYAFIDTAEVSAGYKRDFADSYFTNYIVYDNLYGQLQANIADFRPSAKYSVRFESYEGLYARNDILSRFDLNVAYDLQSWAAINSGFGWQQRASDVQTVEYDDYQYRIFGTFRY